MTLSPVAIQKAAAAEVTTRRIGVEKLQALAQLN